MFRTCEFYARAETSCNRRDPLVICGNYRAREIPGLASALVHVLKHALGGDGSEDFAGKTGRTEPSWDDAQDFARHTR
jgi:hypothetical protein